jgi:hypothetical protein
MDVELSNQYDLAILRIDLDRRGRRLSDGTLGPAAIFEAWRGSEEPTVLARVPPPSGPVRHRREHVDLLDFGPPTEIFTAPFFTALKGEPLWLDLPATAGAMRLLPWERFLEPLGVPVLRLPSLILPARPPATSRLQVALVASSIGEEDHSDFERGIPLMVEAIRSATPRPVSVHVFANEVHERFLRRVLGPDPDVVIHEPPSPEKRIRVTSGSRVPANVENPWLAWMYARLVGVAVDHVHFHCHGDFVLDNGAVSFAGAPDSTDDSYRCVGSPELLAVLTGLGAWSVGFSGPRGNFSPEGLRDVAYAVTDVRPGPVVLQESAADPDFGELGAALSVIWNRLPPPAPRCLATAIWIDPSLLQGTASTVSAAGTTDRVLTSLLSTETGAALTAERTPTWVAATARVLEQAGAHWLASEPVGPDRRRRQATVEALRFAADLLEEHVKEAGPSGKEGRRST